MIVKFVRIFHPCLFAVHPRGGVRLFCFLRALPAKGNARQRGAHRLWQPLGLRHERDPREQAGRAQGDHRGRIAGGGHRLQHGAGRAGGLPLLGVGAAQRRAGHRHHRHRPEPDFERETELNHGDLSLDPQRRLDRHDGRAPQPVPPRRPDLQRQRDRGRGAALGRELARPLPVRFRVPTMPLPPR